MNPRYPNPSVEVQELNKNWYVLKFPSSDSLSQSTLLTKLANTKGVKYIEPNAIRHCPSEHQTNQTFNFPDTSLDNPYTPNDPLFPQQWDKTKMQCEYVWGADINGEDIIIAYIDSGVDTDHEDLIDNIIPGKSFISGSYEDDFRHGTNISGIGSAKGDNNKGIAGVSYNSPIMPLKFIDKDGVGKVSNEVKAIYYATENNVDVINMSFGSYSSYTSEENAINYAYEKGLVLFAGAGNDNRNASNFFPCSYENTIAIAASDENDKRWSKSNFGSSVDFYAPGNNILTTELGGGYATHSGTSCSTGQASGVGALMLEANPSLTPERVRELLSESADTITTDKGKVLRVNAKRAVEKALDEPQGIEEQTPTQRPPELTDIILNPSNLYQENFPGRGTLTIYEASTGRRVQAPIQVYGHVDVDFSGFPAGVYFGVYKPQEGSEQVGKIIKTQ